MQGACEHCQQLNQSLDNQVQYGYPNLRQLGKIRNYNSVIFVILFVVCIYVRKDASGSLHIMMKAHSTKSGKDRSTSCAPVT